MKSTFLPFSFLFLLLGAIGCRIQKYPPELTGISPKQAPIGQEITLTGYQFSSTPTVTVGVAASAVAATVGSSDDNTIKITVPLVNPGRTQIRVQTDEGTSDPLPFIVEQPAPTLSTITPANGLPGTTVELTGAYLNQVRYVRFANVDIAVKDSSAQKLTVTVPPNIPRGPQTIVIETSGGVSSGSFIVAGTPQITSLSAKKIRPGSELIIKGVNLTDGLVYINGMGTDRSRTSVQDTEIRTIVPEFAQTGRVTVTVFDKLVATSADTLQIVQQPAIANLSAPDGIAGDKIILTGQNLREISAVSFGSLPATYRVISDTQLEATVPTLPSSGAVTVSASGVGGNTSAADPFFFYQAPTNITVNPARQLNNRPITISGQNLYRITEVRVSGQAVPITSRTEGFDLLVNVPANVVSGPVTVINRAGSASTAKPLVVIQKPVITDIIPKKARPGERVVLRGDFLLNAQILFSGTTTAAVDGGKNEDTERWVLVPADAQTGPIQVVNVLNDPVTTETFTVLRLIPDVDFTPKSAKVGTEVVLTGQNVASVQEIRFGNGTSSPAKFTLINTTSLKVTVPADAVTGQICLTNEAGKSCSTSSFTVAK
ncbi:IPT/TIG domain-containing protein [Spirosoma soli]|uniref:IPT/TIG domain-containing protein n=1 Tax=Spirosoma soli TaxID=1770529 RepID=A0ABW5MDA1_9BACT